MKNVSLIALAVLICCGALNAQPKTKLKGVWRVTEVRTTGPNAGTNSNPQPGLILFTDKYYSIMRVTSDRPRPDLPADPAKATAAELNAVYGVFTANSGTYEVSGDTMVTHPLVAQNPLALHPGYFATYSFKLEGKMLTLTRVRNANGPDANPTTMKLSRLE
jgi:hypothetical protein